MKSTLSVQFIFLMGLAMGGASTPKLALAEDLMRVIYPRVLKARAQGKVPVAVFDLDETLINSTPRRFFAIQSALLSLSAGFPWEVEKLKGLRMQHLNSLKNRYSTQELLSGFGVFNLDFQKQLETRFLKQYLGGGLVEFDHDMPCATSLLRSLIALGVLPVFITSRFISSQMSGTVASLQELQMARASDVFRLYLRPDGMASIEFKKMAFAKTHQLGAELGREIEIIAASENEPENMNAMTSEFPEALKFFVRGAFIKDELLVLPPNARTHGPFVISNFCQ